jgi:hypothetical protein
MALAGSPVINYRTYRVTAPEFIPCFPSFKGNNNSATEIPRGYFLKFLSEPEADLWEVEFFDPNDASLEPKKGFIGSWAWQWLLPVFQKNR